MISTNKQLTLSLCLFNYYKMNISTCIYKNENVGIAGSYWKWSAFASCIITSTTDSSL